MKKTYLTASTILLLIASIIFTSAQNKAKPKKNIRSSQSTNVFDEFYTDDVSIKEQKKRLKIFALKVKNTPNAHGDIYLYRGATDYKFNFKRAYTVFNYLHLLATENNIISFNIDGNFGGFRDRTTIEMIFQPTGTPRRPPTSNISLLDMKYLDDKKIEEGTIQLTGHNLLKNLIKKVEPRQVTSSPSFIPLTKAVIFIKIDENGNVINTSNLLGFGLFGVACENAVKKWQFKPEKPKGIALKVVGIVVCDFKPVDE